MMHLTEDQLYHLAELSCDAELLNTEEEKQLDHAKGCRECFEKYCVLATILDAVSLNCELDFGFNEIPESVAAPVAKVLAALRITCVYMNHTMSVRGEQIQKNKARFAFEPVLQAAVRGKEKGESSVLRMEDLDDEYTCFIYDAENHKLMIQFDANGKEAESFKVYLKCADQTTIDIPLVKSGTYLKGTLSDVPSGSFDICMEEKEISDIK